MIQVWKRYHQWLILISVAAALGLGMTMPHLFAPIQFLGDLFIHLLKLFALPLVCSALIAALGEVSGDLAPFRSLAKKMIGYMLTSEIIAVSIALILFNLFQPGAHSDPALILNGQPYEPTHAQPFGLPTLILSIVPSNIFEALAHFDLLPVVVFSILFGIGCASIGKAAQPMVHLALSVREISSKCLHGVMQLAPIGIFSLVGTGVAQAHLSGTLKESFTALLSFVLVLILGLLCHVLWQLFAVAFFTKQKIRVILSESLPVFSTAFGTSSSVATLPVAMQVANQLNSKPFVSRFVLPLCASLNVGGMMMYEVAATLFFSQMLGIDLSLSQQALLAFACILGGMAEGGIPESSMVSLVVVFRIVNIPLSAISILLPLDRILDRLRTMANIFGNMCGVILISRWTETSQKEVTVVEESAS